ncbi:MAG: hypothetical protein ACI4RT_08580 [Candidatus Spyradenecus sp.]
MSKENIDGLGTRRGEEAAPGPFIVASIVALAVGIFLFILRAWFEW